MKREKILILSGNYGEGHQQAARAISEAIQLRHFELEPVIQDYMEIAHPLVYPLSRSLFNQGVKKFPSIYRYFYRRTHSGHVLPSLLRKLNYIGIKRMYEMIHELRPRVVVNTFPLAAGAVSVLKELGLTNIPSVTIITDYTEHNSWIHPHTNHYIVGSETVGQNLKHLGISDANISVTGIPIRPAFGMSYRSTALMQKYNINPCVPTLLMMGGGWGIMGDGIESFLALDQLPQPVQLIIVCGNNHRLKKQLDKALKYSKHRVLITGHVNYIHELMAISDILITKPGGLTVSEAIAMELPMLLYKPLLGQEQDNARLLLELGVALQTENTADMLTKLSEMLADPQRLALMRNHAKKINQKHAVFDALDVILQNVSDEETQANEA
ncbi:MGDG synthase family glycosyltransferase [Aneurinibacillus terranovensis]|uniref:MGDG synthase family glycosyltransferase n=1 Tax=Aneurinibacillus terranovensis TaxID=278991 RepID=UPI000422F23E|nr:glycosyltransferase [Aneurinibacillus terranovensis]